MPVESGYKPEPNNWDISTWKNKMPENTGDFSDKPAGDPELTVNNTDSEKTIKNTEDNLKNKESSQLLENNQNNDNSLVAQIQQDLAGEKAKLSNNINAYPESYQQLVKDHIALLEKALTREQAKEKTKYIDNDSEIKAMRSILSRQDLGPKDREIFSNMLDSRIARLKEGRELKEGELSPETLDKEKNIKEIAMRAIDPVSGKNILEQDKRVSYARDEIAQILQENINNPELQKSKIKEYLINNLDNSIVLRNEAKYGKGFMGKLKKFFNEGWAGALAKTAGGVGLISGGLYSGAGIFSPMIYAAGIRLASEGVTQLAQEINNAFNKNSRKALFEQGRNQLDKIIKEKMAQLATNPEINSQQKYEQALMQFINDTYANEVKTLVDLDTDHLRKAEKLRKIAGWTGTAAGLLVGMPMDIDADGVSHFVNMFGNGMQGVWFNGAASHGFGNSLGLGSWGAIENLASYGAGSMATYVFARGTEGDERKFKLNLATTMEENQKLQEAQANSSVHLTANNSEKVTAKNTEIKQNTQKENIDKAKNEENANNPEIKKYDLDNFIDELQKADSAKLKELYEKETGLRQELVGIKVIADFPESIQLEGDENKRDEYFIAMINNIFKNVISENKNRVSSEKAAIIRSWIKNLQKNFPSLEETNKIASTEEKKENISQTENIKQPLVLSNEQQHYVNELYYDYLQSKGYDISKGEAHNNAYYGTMLKQWLQKGSLTNILDLNNIAGSKDKFYQFLDKQTFTFGPLSNQTQAENKETTTTL